jgi:leader peptidase (prepilin peptidase)/N-methyltransferase
MAMGGLFGGEAGLARSVFAGASVAAALASVLIAPSPRGPLGACLALLMCAIALYDARYFIIPDFLNALAFLLGLAHAPAAAVGPILPELADALLRGAVSGGSFLALKLGYRWLRGREGIGLGDVKLAAVAGVWLDWTAIPIAVDIAVVAALATYLMRHMMLRRPLRATSALPFGLFLAPAIWGAWFVEIVLLTP